MKAIIFDFDGVIHNTFELVCEIHKQINPNFCKNKFKTYFEGNIFNTIDKKPNQKNQKIFRKKEQEAFKTLKIEKEIESELKKLNKQYDLYIISSNTIKNLETYFKNNNFTNIFKEILAAETHKSKEIKFKILFKKHNLTPKSCIFITDTLGDIKEANKIGIKTIACTFGYHNENILKKGNPFKIISDFKEIRKTIENIKKL